MSTCGEFSETTDDDELYASDGSYCKDKNYGRSKRCIKTMNDLNKFRYEEKLCDKVLKVDGREFPVHSAVLASASPYFCAMFTGSFDEREKKCIEIRDVRRSTFKIILNFIYGEELKVNEDNMLQLYQCGDMLCIEKLSRTCKSYLRSMWPQMKNKKVAYELAEQLNLGDVMYEIKDYYRKNLIAIIQEDYFLEVVREILEEEKKGISSLLVVNILMALLLWLEHDYDGRVAEVNKLISLFHLDELIVVTKENLVGMLTSLIIANETAAKYKDALVRKIQSKLAVVWFKLCNFKKMFVCVTNDRSQVVIREFHYDTMEWTKYDPRIGVCYSSTLPQVKKSKGNFTTDTIQAVALCKDKLYIFGSETVHTYSLTKRKTRALASLPKKRSGFCVVEYDNTLIVIGGKEPEVLQYSIVEDSWQEVCTLDSPPTHYISASLHNDVVYMVYRSKPVSETWTDPKYTDVLSYDFSLKSLVKLKGINYSMDHNMHTVVFGNKLYVFGRHVSEYSSKNNWGCTKLSGCPLCHIYDPEKNAWSDSQEEDTFTFGESIVDVVSVADGILLMLEIYSIEEPKMIISLYEPKLDCLKYLARIPSHRDLMFNTEYLHAETR